MQSFLCFLSLHYMQSHYMQSHYRQSFTSTWKHHRPIYRFRNRSTLRIINENYMPEMQAYLDLSVSDLLTNTVIFPYSMGWAQSLRERISHPIQHNAYKSCSLYIALNDENNHKLPWLKLTFGIKFRKASYNRTLYLFVKSFLPKDLVNEKNCGHARKFLLLL